MKLEIIKEEEYNQPTWYLLRVNGRTVSCSRTLEEIEKSYKEIKENPEMLNPSRIVLKSEEIVVNLQEKN